MVSIIDQLKNTGDVLHLFYHRNRNQHRQCHWWKWLSMLKRCVKKLKEEIVGKKFVRVHRRIRHMKDMLLPRCYVSFTQLVQDNRFSVLGLTLMAELANVRQIILSYADAERESADDRAETRTAEKVFAPGPTEDFGEAVARSIDFDSTLHDSAIPATSKLPSEIIQASATQGLAGVEVEGTDTDLLHGIHRAQRSVENLLGNGAMSPSSAPMRRQKEKPKGKANPIDDLFDRLG